MKDDLNFDQTPDGYDDIRVFLKREIARFVDEEIDLNPTGNPSVSAAQVHIRYVDWVWAQEGVAGWFTVGKASLYRELERLGIQRGRGYKESNPRGSFLGIQMRPEYKHPGAFKKGKDQVQAETQSARELADQKRQQIIRFVDETINRNPVGRPSVPTSWVYKCYVRWASYQEGFEPLWLVTRNALYRELEQLGFQRGRGYKESNPRGSFLGIQMNPGYDEKAVMYAKVYPAQG